MPNFPHFEGITRVPWDWPEWNLPDFNRNPIHRPPPPMVSETIHEVIELSISQNVTMERDAFWAGLGIRNKMLDKNIDNVMVTLHIKDDTGSANDKFFIKALKRYTLTQNPEELDQINCWCELVWRELLEYEEVSRDSSLRLVENAYNLLK